jgi:hypothetical protein
MSGSTFHPNHREWNSLFRQTAERHGKLTGYVSSHDKYRHAIFNAGPVKCPAPNGDLYDFSAVQKIQIQVFAQPVHWWFLAGRLGLGRRTHSSS